MPTTSDTFKHMSKIINSLCISLCFSVSLQLTCILETFSNNMATTTTCWLCHCGAWPPTQNRWKRPFCVSPHIVQLVSRSFNTNWWCQARTGIKVVCWQRWTLPLFHYNFSNSPYSSGQPKPTNQLSGREVNVLMRFELQISKDIEKSISKVFPTSD